MDKKSLSDRLRQVGLNKARPVGQDESVKLLGSIYLSRTKKPDPEKKAEKIPTEMQNIVETKGSAHRAVEMLGKAIRKKTDALKGG
ncbi:MAG TPA: hypothetical protein HPQ03_04615 [Deltaproteobacteria bacterium]|nr:hypothetical protein [Deltaproteobacteria bacterium]